MEENVNRNFGTNRDSHWVIEILGSSRFGINRLVFGWGHCGGMTGNFCILILATLLLKSDYFVPMDISN